MPTPSSKSCKGKKEARENIKYLPFLGKLKSVPRGVLLAPLTPLVSHHPSKDKSLVWSLWM
ncbi:unnamed protein product [Prunus armeniaca]|uniref:Uncharacterized protein n=1 Tax=Prunus armeniaca TaxID=36596 RepID=A0A6J5TIK4_PRUAR|nr:unnamed protein product [Prunus armeniaca]CAB4294365.1 unnamed protein product [Prunus armeniaca]